MNFFPTMYCIKPRSAAKIANTTTMFMASSLNLFTVVEHKNPIYTIEWRNMSINSLSICQCSLTTTMHILNLISPFFDMSDIFDYLFTILTGNRNTPGNRNAECLAKRLSAGRSNSPVSQGLLKVRQTRFCVTHGTFSPINSPIETPHFLRI